MAQSQNQFKQSPVKGQLDLALEPNTIQCVVDPNQVTALVPGQAVVLSNLSDQIPMVAGAAARTDDIFGFVNYDLKLGSFGAGDRVSISFFRGNVQYMEAAAAFAPYVRLEPVISGSTVQTAVSGGRVIGFALDKASAAGDLVRVVIDLPGTTV